MCAGHRPYRTKQDARARLDWHLPTQCVKCQQGKVWHVWQCEHRHWHVGHGRRRKRKTS